MLRLLALPVAVAAVLASSGCAAGDRGGEPTAPGTTPGEAPEAYASPSSEAPAEDGGATGGPTGSAAPSTAPPAAMSSTAPAPSGDPGTPGLPEHSGASVDDVLRLGAVATWIERPVLVALSLPATPSCWAFAGAPEVESTTRMVVRVEVPTTCEAPDGARTYAIPVPPGIDASAEVELAVVGLEHEFTLTLPGR